MFSSSCATYANRLIKLSCVPRYYPNACMRCLWSVSPRRICIQIGNNIKVIIRAIDRVVKTRPKSYDLRLSRSTGEHCRCAFSASASASFTYLAVI